VIIDFILKNIAILQTLLKDVNILITTKNSLSLWKTEKAALYALMQIEFETPLLPGVLRTKVDRVDLKKSLIVCDYYMLSN
jgi:hypothetical protein